MYTVPLAPPSLASLLKLLATIQSTLPPFFIFNAQGSAVFHRNAKLSYLNSSSYYQRRKKPEVKPGEIWYNENMNMRKNYCKKKSLKMEIQGRSGGLVG